MPSLCQRCVPIGLTGSADSGHCLIRQDNRESRATFSSSTSTPSTASTCPPLAFTNRDSTVDTLLPDSLNDHSQAAFELFLTVRETARGWVSKLQYKVAAPNPPLMSCSSRSRKEPLLRPSCRQRTLVPQVSCAPSVNRVGAALFLDVCCAV